MAKKYFLGIDAGQTFTKAVIHDDNMQQVSLARTSSPMSSPHNRWLERTHESLWQASATAISESLRKAGISASDIAAIGISGHGDGVHLVDANGGAVGPAIMAVDSRAFAEMQEINSNKEVADRILRASGQVPFLGSPGALLKWISKHQPELLDQASYLLSCKDVLRHRLTGQIGTDYSDASASFLNIDKAEWDPQVIADYGLAGLERLMPPINASYEVVGKIHAAAAEATGLAVGTPVVTGLHDVQACAVGMGSLVENKFTLIAGSFSINAVTTTEKHTGLRWQNHLATDPTIRMAMSTSATCSTTLEWCFQTLNIQNDQQRDALFAKAAEIPAGESVPLMLPYLYASPFGEAPSGSILGLRSWHSPAHFLRGVLEGITYMHVLHTEALAEKFTWTSPLRISGGLSNSRLYTQMVSNALGADVEVVKNDETGSLGVAVLAATGVGHFASVVEAAEYIEVKERFTPEASQVNYWSDRKASLQAASKALEPLWFETDFLG
jgi:L-xylulokinase